MADSQEYLIKLSRELADKGKLIEAGWISLRAMALPLDAPQLQLQEMRNAFFAGAQHLFSSMLTMMEDGADETPGDLNRMSLIQQELDKFIEQYKLKFITPQGRA